MSVQKGRHEVRYVYFYFITHAMSQYDFLTRLAEVPCPGPRKWYYIERRIIRMIIDHGIQLTIVLLETQSRLPSTGSGKRDIFENRCLEMPSATLKYVLQLVSAHRIFPRTQTSHNSCKQCMWSINVNAFTSGSTSCKQTNMLI